LQEIPNQAEIIAISLKRATSAAIMRKSHVVAGMPTGTTVMGDRAAAIQAAICQAQPGDGVLIAGKGHEDYQILGTEKVHFDDREQARSALAIRLRAVS
jgi:UDP-N-acetylmuramyl tripeptide synthase